MDAQCKIRWAGSAVADESEKASMVRCLRRLLQDERQAKPAQGEPTDKADSVIEGDQKEEEKKAEAVLGEVTTR